METDIQKIKSLKGKKGVLDNNILNDFIELDRIPLLNEVFAEVFIPQSILDKEAILVSIQEGLGWLEFQAISLFEETSLIFLEQIIDEKPGLTEYDAECVAIARENMIYCTSNEKRVMNTCRDYGIECTGTVGIICCAFEHGIIARTELESLLRKLFSDECSAFLSPKLKRKVFTYYEIV